MLTRVKAPTAVTHPGFAFIGAVRAGGPEAAAERNHS